MSSPHRLQADTDGDHRGKDGRTTTYNNVETITEAPMACASLIMDVIILCKRNDTLAAALRNSGAAGQVTHIVVIIERALPEVTNIVGPNEYHHDCGLVLLDDVSIRLVLVRRTALKHVLRERAVVAVVENRHAFQLMPGEGLPEQCLPASQPAVRMD